MSSPLQEPDLNTSPTPDPGTTDNNDPSAVCTDSDSDTDGPEPDAPRPTLVLKMLSLLKELSIMALVALAYAALTNERPPKVSKSPAAYPFFPRDSHVTDWYKGQITAAIEEARASDLAFVMFYAPWDAESQNARRELELAAKYLHEKVAFAAVNCWQPGSECKRQYSKVYKWPVLIAYPTHGRGIQYNGPLEAFHMIRFLLNMCQPLVRPDKLDDLMGKHNIVVSANINVLPGSYDYAVFYATALRFLERDPFRDTVFAVFPQKYDDEGSIFLHNWNGTIKYDGEWSPDSIAQWIVMNSHHLTGWVTPTGMKSVTLATFMQPGPTLILFTPKNPLVRENDYYDMLREIAHEYFNCETETYVSTRLKLITAERTRNKENYYKLKNKCLNRQTPARRGVITNLSNIWTNTTFRDICNCVSSAPIYTPCPKSDTSVSVPDKLSPNQLQKAVREEECHNFLLAEKYAPPIFERRGVEGGANVTGLACATNSSLKFVAIDSLRFFQFAERLGLDLSKSEDKSGVVVVNEKMETHHVMAANISSANLRSYVHNFTQKTLSRSLRSKVYINASEHVYPYSNCSKREQFCLMELSSENFLSTILQRNKEWMILFLPGLTGSRTYYHGSTRWRATPQYCFYQRTGNPNRGLFPKTSP
ncbi:uncharacterized protein LOC135123281 isoform X2 [Zophobas morio]|uniref:uncharacterized protein LOC135123281 isoform X2 n=1 Tax=Zophobas morio TaxID=2755281 RepID=UPI0030829A2C